MLKKKRIIKHVYSFLTQVVVIMCGKRKSFLDFDDMSIDSVELDNNSNMVVNGKGKIRVEMNQFISIITRVFYVSELKNNLLSLGQIARKGTDCYVSAQAM